MAEEDDFSVWGSSSVTISYFFLTGAYLYTY